MSGGGSESGGGGSNKVYCPETCPICLGGIVCQFYLFLHQVSEEGGMVGGLILVLRSSAIFKVKLIQSCYISFIIAHRDAKCRTSWSKSPLVIIVLTYDLSYEAI